MMNYIFAGLALVLVLTFGSTIVAAQQQSYRCAAFQSIRDGMLRQWGEVPTHLGQAGNDNSGNFTVIFTNKETQTYTIVIVFKKGMTCIIAGGRNFHYQPAPEKVDDFPS